MRANSINREEIILKIIEENIRIIAYSYQEYSGTRKFNSLKRKKWTEWKFLVNAVWSPSPVSSAELIFLISSTADRKFWALKLKMIGFPVHICLVSEVINESGTDFCYEKIAAMLLAAYQIKGGELIEYPIFNKELDSDLIWMLYFYYIRKWQHS